jgi:hypothetical protein
MKQDIHKVKIIDIFLKKVLKNQEETIDERTKNSMKLLLTKPVQKNKSRN